MIQLGHTRIFTGKPVLPVDLRGAVFAMGSFDGMHPGHRAVIEQARAEAQRRGAPLGIIVLEPLPREYFQPTAEPLRLTTRNQRRALLADLKVDLLIELTFDDALAQQTEEEFCRNVVGGDLGAQCIIVGADFSFGRGRTGTVETLRDLGAKVGFDLSVTAPVRDDSGEKTSSSYIRDAIRQGDMRLAARFLGRPWEIEAIVASGEKRGRTIGYPTANMYLGKLIHPRFGVYAVRCAAEDGVWRDGVANFGRTPTTGLRDALLEVHIFDFQGDLYGQTLRTQMIEFLRPEEKFDSLDALIAQMDRDSAEARAILAA